MPLRRTRKRLRQPEPQVEVAFLIRRRLDLEPFESGSHPRAGDLVARETPGHVAQVIPDGIVLAGTGDARLLQDAALEEELARRSISPVGQDLERVQQPQPPLRIEPEPVEALLDGVCPYRYRSSPVHQLISLPMRGPASERDTTSMLASGISE